MNDLRISNVLRIDSVRRTCRIRDMNGSDLVIGWCGTISDSSIPENEVGLRALVDYSSKEPTIVSFLPVNSGYADKKQIEFSSETGGEEKDFFESLFAEEFSYQSFQETRVKKNFRYKTPYDMIAGDILFRNKREGNYLLIGRGGLNVLKVSETNQIIQSLLDNLTRVLARNLEFITDFGVLNFYNNDGQVKMHLKASRNHSDVKIGDYDIDLQVGSCDDGNTVSFKYITEKNRDPYLYTIDRSGQEFKHVPSNSMYVFEENLIESVAENRGAYVGKSYMIEVGEKMVVESPGEGSIRMGSEDLNSHENALVRRPHLDKYKQLIQKIKTALIQATVPVPSLPLAVRNAGLAQIIAEIAMQEPIVDNDKTTDLWGE